MDVTRRGEEGDRERFSTLAHRCSLAGSAPLFALEERLDAVSNLVTNRPDSTERFAPGILERPVIALKIRRDWALIIASHGDQPLGSLRQLG